MKSRGGPLCLLALCAASALARPTAQGEFGDLLKKGTTLSQQADYGHAISVLKQAKRLQPRHYLTNLLLGVDWLRSGHPAEAISPLRLAAEVNPKDPTAEGYLGEAATALGNFALAAEAFQAAVSRAPDSEEALLGWADYSVERFRVVATWLRGSQKGVAATLRVEAEGAEDGTAARESLLRQSAASDPEQRGIWGELGIAQLQLGMRPEAQSSLEAARARQPNASSTWRLEALLDAAGGKWPEAEARLLALGGRSPAGLQKALAEWPRNLLPGDGAEGVVWPCLRKPSRGCLAQVGFPKARADLNAEQLFGEERWEQLAAMPPPSADRASVWFMRGVALGELGNCGRAIPALERGLKYGAEAGGFWLEICYGAEAGLVGARLAAEGKNAAIHRLRGDMLLRMKGDAAAAEAEYAEARRLGPGDPDLSERLARAYLALGDLARAKQAARDALSQDPRRMLALRLLAVAMMRERDYPAALVVLGKMAAMDPGNGWIRVEMGTAYAQTGQAEEAVHCLEPALAAGYPDEKGALHAALAKALRKLGREQEAKRAAAEAGRLADRFQAQGKNSPDDHQ